MTINNLYVIHSKTSTNNNKLCIIKKTKNPEFLQAQLICFHDGAFYIQNTKFLISHTSVTKASIHDIIRNLDNTAIECLIPKNILTMMTNIDILPEP